MTQQVIHPCTVCGQASPAAFRLYFDGPVRLWRCRRCGYVARNIGPGAFRPVDRVAGDQVKAFLRSARQWMHPHRRRVLQDLCRRLGRFVPAGSLLDIGCGDGQFLHCCRQAGFEAQGIEADEALAEHAARASGAVVRSGPYHVGRYPPGSFDAVTLIQVLEHLPDPAAALAAARRHVRPGGVVMIEVPSIRSPHWLAWRVTGIRRLLDNRFGVFPEHVGYYSPRSLETLTRRAGFERVSLITGRWRFKYTGGLRALGYALDPVWNLLGIGGILYFGRKQ